MQQSALRLELTKRERTELRAWKIFEVSVEFDRGIYCWSSHLSQVSHSNRFPSTGIPNSPRLPNDHSQNGEVYVNGLVKSSWDTLVPEKPAGFIIDGSQNSSRNARMSLKRQTLSGGQFISQYSRLDMMQKNRNFNLLCGSRSNHLNHLPFVCYSAEAAYDIYDDDSYDEQLDDKADLGAKAFKLISGSSYLPHPAKVGTGGEDAHFVCMDEQVMGVADGVGGWASVGVDSGIFARELMSNAVRAIQQEPRGSVDPLRVLEKAHSSTRAKGSSTACIVSLANKGLVAINLGDSGFLVVRNGSTICRSRPQQHDFNCPYRLQSGNEADLPHSGEIYRVAVAPGDVIITGTDGLFDNLYDSEVITIVVQALRTGLGAEATAQRLTALARQRANDRNRQTPFSAAAQEAGFLYYGGKLDDITVVVSYVTS